MVPELVTLDCSFTHVLPAPNIQPYHNWYLKTGVICEVVTPQRQDHILSSSLAILLLQLRNAGLLSLKIEWANSISIQNWGYVWSHHTQRQCQYWQSPLAKLVFEKRKKKGVICEVVTPQRKDQVWSSHLAMLLLQLQTAGLLDLKIEWANSISVQNWGYVWSCHTQRLSEMTKPPCIKITEIKIK